MTPEADRVHRSIRFPEDDGFGGASDEVVVVEVASDLSIRLPGLIERMSAPCSPAALDRIAELLAQLLAEASVSSADDAADALALPTSVLLR